MYYKTHYTVNTKILRFENDSDDGLKNYLEKSSLSILSSEGAARAGLFAE